MVDVWNNRSNNMMNIHSNHSPVVNYSRREERCCRNVLSVIFGEDLHQKFGHSFSSDKLGSPFQETTSFGRFEVHVLQNPTAEKFRQNFEACRPDFVCLRGNLGHEDAAVGSTVARDVEMHTLEDLAALFDFALPTSVYLEFPDTEKVAEAIHNKGVPHVIYWKSPFFPNAASYFSHALISVFRSSYSHIWDTFQYAHACFRVYCEQNDISILTDDGKINENVLPFLVGESPEIVIPPGIEAGGENIDFPVDSLPFVKIHDDDVQARFLICGRPHQKDTRLLEALEDGLNSLVNIEIRGSKLQNRVSAPPPALQMETSRGVVTMRCDLSTCSSTYISFLVSGSAQTCFDDQVLDSHLKNEIVESRLVQALRDTELCKSHLRRSVSLAGGAIVFEVVMMLPSWTSQVLRQLAQDIFYKSFVTLGVAGIQGLAVNSFEKEDADRLLFSRKPEETYVPTRRSILPLWLKPPLPHKKTFESAHIKRERSNNFVEFENFGSEVTLEKLNPGFTEVSLLNSTMDHSHFDKKSKIAAMRPVPRMNHRNVRPLPGIVNTDGTNGVQGKAIFPIVPTKHILGIPAIPRRKTISSSTQVKQALPLNPLPLKKHGCGRCPIRHCSEGEFLKDVIQFLILRGHTRLIPQGGLPEFPDAILNAKRLDLYNLYREVVSRGGFHVGNGINWKGQVFSKMQNYTTTNRMTGVGNTLKRHYETYLLEYELAHDDVDGECCLLCHSSAVGDWVNCGICGEWAHFGCDKRLGLAAFKDYAKTAGLEYICPHCTATASSKKLHRIMPRE